ncbi:unnamed protein product [Hyaloperonospora brassicae]|uniref:Uncharacterized protein n=1 Tax=Hyaloperonospora brassicae TaxID=162125 RepID=A0AAV0TAV3_HYABA|nr:unnamed protein product [Hyaloperonospora brassicae]
MSDAETVCTGDSPLSPCMWTHPVAAQVAAAEVAAAAVSDKEEEDVPLVAKSEPAATAPLFRSNSRRFDRSQRLPRHELQLSPASQLDVLAQISELADAQSRQSIATDIPTRQPKRSSVWGPAMQTAKRTTTARLTVPSRTSTKRQKHVPKQSARSQAERLAADMLDWETCSEGELFALDGEDEDDLWVYEDIVDSDFET